MALKGFGYFAAGGFKCQSPGSRVQRSKVQRLEVKGQRYHRITFLNPEPLNPEPEHRHLNADTFCSQPPAKRNQKKAY